MTRIMVMTSLPLAEVKSKFSEMIDRVEDTHDRITVTRNGRAAAVIVSPEDLEALEDTLDLLSDPAAVAQLHESQKAHAEGDYVGVDMLKAKYLRR
jgi:antitoxin YefM